VTDNPNPDPTFTTRADLEAWARRLVWATGDKHPSFTGDTIVRVTLAHLHLKGE
jgi:hypothetical protein